MTVGTTVLGPGKRSVLWVQGCPFHCAGCIAPDWIPFRPANAVNPVEAAGYLLSDPEVTGITLSGGEPMMQALPLARLLEAAQRIRPVNVVVYTGFRYEDLHKHPPVVGVHRLLEMVDVLIDGPFIQKLNDNKGVRGSSNQRILRLTNKLDGFDFEDQPRSIELRVQNGQILIIGVPDNHLLQTLDQIVDRK
ncbi:MAG: radical SAM protein [Anaerolineaceae bacterium]|nr:radical SAM protein [Anaerolineaceae bacterium]